MKYLVWSTDVECLPSFFFNHSIVILLTICAGTEFQIFTILLKKKYFASFDLKSLSMILKPFLRLVLVRSVACGESVA